MFPGKANTFNTMSHFKIALHPLMCRTGTNNSNDLACAALFHGACSSISRRVVLCLYGIEHYLTYLPIAIFINSFRVSILGNRFLLGKPIYCSCRVVWQVNMELKNRCEIIQLQSCFNSKSFTRSYGFKKDTFRELWTRYWYSNLSGSYSNVFYKNNFYIDISLARLSLCGALLQICTKPWSYFRKHSILCCQWWI